MKAMKGVPAWLLVLALAAAIGMPAQAIEEGAPAPGYEIHLFNGQAFGAGEGSGKVVLLHFWASWCVPCREEMPAMERYYQKHHQEGLELIAISMDDAEDLQKARDIMKGYSFPGAWIRDAKVRGYGRIWRIPLTFVIDRKGILRHDAWDGDAGIDESTLDKTISPLLSHP